MHFKIDHTEICRIVKTVWRKFDIRYDSLCIRTITKFWVIDLIQIGFAKNAWQKHWVRYHLPCFYLYSFF